MLAHLLRTFHVERLALALRVEVDAYEHTMIFKHITRQYRRSAVGLVILGALLSFALGQRVGHVRTESLNVARSHSVPIVSARTSGAIGTAVVTQTNKPAATVPLRTSTGAAFQSWHTEQKHSHGHGKGDTLATLVAAFQSYSAGYGSHQGGGDGD